MKRDEIYALPRDRVGDFSFDDAVADAFPDMISRSVPGYGSILTLIEQLSSRFIAPNTNAYDLGCSLGAATLLMRKRSPASATIHAVDNSAAMLSRLRARLESESSSNGALCPVDLHETDVCSMHMANASFIVLNLTLQFVREDRRCALLQASYDALLPGGAMLLSEKVCFDDASQQALMTELHHDFKRANGYSDLEISQKRTALENRLVPETLQTHLSRLTSVGFKTVAPWFQCFNFVSVLAVK